MAERTNFGLALLQIRETRNISGLHLAESIGLNKNKMYAIEIGKCKLRDEILEKIIGILGLFNSEKEQLLIAVEKDKENIKKHGKGKVKTKPSPAPEVNTMRNFNRPEYTYEMKKKPNGSIFYAVTKNGAVIQNVKSAMDAIKFIKVEKDISHV